MAKREPHVVLGVETDATPIQIKAAWRKLARSHHPDLTGDDPEASRVATREMAEINEAYAAMTRPGSGSRRTGAGAAGPAGGAGFDEEPARPRRSAVPRPRPTRPVTGRVDMSETVRPRNASLHQAGAAAPGPRPVGSPGQPPLRPSSAKREPPRASDPTGPLERSRLRNFRRPPLPPLDVAVDHEIDFGKFRGHTLGEVASFEPSYVDWLARTITRNPDLVAAARTVQQDLDRRGVPRREHPATRPDRSA